eukprot:g1422.t1
MGSAASTLPLTEEDALAQGYTQEQIDEYKSKQPPYYDRARKVFLACDTDKSGQINYAELKKVFGNEHAKEYMNWMDGFSKEKKKDNRIDVTEWLVFFDWANKSPDGIDAWLNSAESYVVAVEAGAACKASKLEEEKGNGQEEKGNKQEEKGNEQNDDLGGTGDANIDDDENKSNKKFRTYGNSISERARAVFEEVDVDCSGSVNYSEMTNLFPSKVASTYVGWMDGFHKNEVGKANITWEVWVAFFEWTVDPANAKVAGTTDNPLKWIDVSEAYLKKGRAKRFQNTLEHIFRLHGLHRCLKENVNDLVTPLITKTENSEKSHYEVFDKLAKEFDRDLTSVINSHYNLREMQKRKAAEAQETAHLDPKSYLGRAHSVFHAIDTDGSGTLKFSELLAVFAPRHAKQYQGWTDGHHGEKDGLISWSEWEAFFIWAKNEEDAEKYIQEAEDAVAAKLAGKAERHYQKSRAAAIAQAEHASVAEAAAKEVSTLKPNGFPPLPTEIQARVEKVFEETDIDKNETWDAKELSQMFDPVQAQKYLSYMDGYVGEGISDGKISKEEWVAFFAWANAGGQKGIGCENWLKQAEGYVERSKNSQEGAK